MTLPLLEDDGSPLVTSATSADRIARTSYKAGTDEQTFIELGKNVVLASDPPVLSSYGQLRPVRATTDDTAHRTFVYPRTANDPTAEAVRDSFKSRRPAFNQCSVESTIRSTSAGRRRAEWAPASTSTATVNPTRPSVRAAASFSRSVAARSPPSKPIARSPRRSGAKA